MPIIDYSSYSDKRLNEVILLGSHDAGITKGGINARTQKEGIGAQAANGARFFDIRIAAFYNTRIGATAMRAYHDDTKKEMPWTSKNLASRNALGGPITNNRVDDKMKIHGTVLGAKGEGLSDMLLEARKFVEDNPTEFLIFKFDKSENWPQIADVCMTLLGNYIYTAINASQGNLNKRRLRKLAGHVIILFTEEGYNKCGKTSAEGILKWVSRYTSESAIPGAFVDDYYGLQYYGKGGVSADAWGSSAKIRKNFQVQAQLVRGGGSYKQENTAPNGTKTIVEGSHAGVSAQLVGLMYWTTTGPSALGIKSRNKSMWSQSKQKMLVEAATGIAVANLATSQNPFLGGGGMHVKSLMPNIVMVDFVNNQQGKLVRALNDKSGAELQGIITG